jgi:hypothetical protein
MAVRRLLRLVDALPKAARQSWNAARSRVFDIGIQAGMTPSAFEEVALQNTTLAAITQVRGRLLVTVYAPQQDSQAIKP